MEDHDGDGGEEGLQVEYRDDKGESLEVEDHEDDGGGEGEMEVYHGEDHPEKVSQKQKEHDIVTNDVLTQGTFDLGPSKHYLYNLPIIIAVGII